MDIRSYCKENEVVYQSFWILSGNLHILESPVLQRIARGLGTSVEYAFYRFCIQEGIIVLDGTTSEDHMKEDLEVVAVDRFELSVNDMSDIRALLQPKATSGRPKGRRKPGTNGTVRKSGGTIKKDWSDRVGRRTRGKRETRESRS